MAKRPFRAPEVADPLATVMERKLTRMRAKHAQTREYMEINALKGVVKDGAGTTLYDYFDEFGLTRQSVDFVLGSAGTNLQAKVRDVLRKVEEAYKYYSSTGAQPLRDDTRRRFPFAGILFEEYNATVTLSTGTTETLIPAGETCIVRASAEGAVIRSRHGFFRAIPTPAAGKRGGLSASRSLRSGKASETALRSGRGLATVPMFILVPQVTVRKCLDVAGAADKWIAELPRLVVRNWREPGR